jgi:prolyl 4-hydroxylase
MTVARDIDAQLRDAAKLEAAGRLDEATAMFRRAATTGQTAALAALGKHLLVHRPDCGREALTATTAAAKAGNGEAAHLLAVFTAAGVGFPQNWETALDGLERSAELGWEPAQRELAILAGVEDKSGENWKRLREQVDIGAWIATPAARQLRPARRIFAADGFASLRVCDWLIELARSRLKPAATYDPATGVKHQESGRTNSDCHLLLPYGDLVLLLVRARLANLIRIPLAHLEISTVLHYAPGQEFMPHYDFLDDTWPGYTHQIARDGQRIFTFLIYLNDGFEGGETDFPLIGLRHKGRAGDVLFFWNVRPNGAVDRETLHAGLPPATGEKWLFSQWVRNRPA